VTLRNLSQDQLNAIAAELNTRPRRTLAWGTPGAIFREVVSPAGHVRG
jgi:IS30 family transposase